MAEEANNSPIRLKDVIQWSTAGVTIIGMIVSCVLSFSHVTSRCDLLDQRIDTMRAERSEYRTARDKQIDTLNSRCDGMERSVSDITHTLSDLQSTIAVMRSRQDDSIILLKKIDDHINK